MKKILLYTALTAALIACKKEDTTPETQETTQFIRIEEVGEDGSTTISPVVTVKVRE